MQLNGCTLQESDTGQSNERSPSPENIYHIERALFRARAALDAGWQLTPAEAVAFVESGAWAAEDAASRSRGLTQEAEDEIDDIPRYFGERYTVVA